MDRPIESETTKIVENSYRATILAFLNEWSLFAERNGVDLVKVIQAIKVRPTHDNIIFPGPGHRRLLPAEGRRPRLLGLQAHPRLRGPGPAVPDHADGDRHQRHARPARGGADPRRAAQHGPLHRGRERPALRRQLPRGRRRHALQRVGDGGPQAHRDGRGPAGARPVRRPLVRAGEPGHLPGAGPFLGALLPQPAGPHRAARAEGPAGRARRAPRR